MCHIKLEFIVGLIVKSFYDHPVKRQGCKNSPGFLVNAMQGTFG